MYRSVTTGENTQTSHVSSKVGLLHHTHLWYSPNILAKLETPSPFLHFKPGRLVTLLPCLRI